MGTFLAVFPWSVQCLQCLGCGDLLCEVFHSTESSYYGTNPRLGDLVSFFTEVIWTKINCFTLLIFLGQNSEAPMCFAWLVLCLVTQSCLTLCDPMDCSPPGSSVHGFSRQEYWSGLPCPPPGNLLNPGIKPRSPALQADALPSELPGKPKDTGVGSLSLLQGICPI